MYTVAADVGASGNVEVHAEVDDLDVVSLSALRAVNKERSMKSPGRSAATFQAPAPRTRDVKPLPFVTPVIGRPLRSWRRRAHQGEP